MEVWWFAVPLDLVRGVETVSLKLEEFVKVQEPPFGHKVI
jgi:hypothetical protein